MSEQIISVILPVYNCETTIRKCIESVINQSFSQFELIIIDNGSNDNTLKICEEYRKNDSRINIYSLDTNIGASKAREYGIKRTKGDYIAFIDGDDNYLSDFLAAMYDLITRESADIAICGFSYVKGNIVTEHAICDNVNTISRDQALRELLLDNKIRNYMWDKLFKREVFDGIAFPECSYFEDMGVMADIFNNAEKIVLCPYNLYCYHFWDSSLVNRYDHNKFVDGWNQAYGRYIKLNENANGIQDVNAFALIQWYLRLFKYMTIEDDTEDDFLKKNISVIEEALENNKKYVLEALSTSKKALLFSIIYDFDEAKEVARYLYVKNR